MSKVDSKVELKELVNKKNYRDLRVEVLKELVVEVGSDCNYLYRFHYLEVQ